jgi:peptide/nickel transport system permease protein
MSGNETPVMSALRPRSGPGRLPALIARSLGQLSRTRSGAIGAALLALLLLVAILAPWLAPQEPFRLGSESLRPPSAAHLLGTDNIGRDLLSLVIYGARTSLAIGIIAAFMAFLIGCAAGATAGYFRGFAEIGLIRVADLFQTLPSIVVVLFVTAQFGSGFWLLTCCVALVIWPLQAKLVYGQFVHLRNREFVIAAEAAGLSSAHVVFREILPNALPPIIVQIALDASLAIMIESGLGFLGLTDPSVPSWGSVLNVAQNYLDTAWWMSIFPGVAICLAVLAFNLFADGLNALLNPRRTAKRISWSSP